MMQTNSSPKTGLCTWCIAGWVALLLMCCTNWFTLALNQVFCLPCFCYTIQKKSFLVTKPFFLLKFTIKKIAFVFQALTGLETKQKIYIYFSPCPCSMWVLPPWGFMWLQHTDLNVHPSLYPPSHFCSYTTKWSLLCSWETCLCCFELAAGVKQQVAPGMKSVQVVGQPPLTAIQKNKLKEGGGETFRFVTHSYTISCQWNTDCQLDRHFGVWGECVFC